jgi:hypothetical protein
MVVGFFSLGTAWIVGVRAVVDLGCPSTDLAGSVEGWVRRRLSGQVI